MPKYHEQNWSQRFKSLGDEAEAMFTQSLPLGKAQRLGWRRPTVTMRHMPPTLKHMPDYYTEGGMLVEVMGMGADGILKLKTTKWEALKWWNKLCPVTLFLWNSAARCWCTVPWSSLKWLVRLARISGIKSFENDGNTYYPIQWEWIERCEGVVKGAPQIQ